MKKTILIFALIVFSISSPAQTYTVAYNQANTIDRPTSRNEILSANFLREIFQNEDFEYREFLKDSKDSRSKYKYGKKNYSKTELVKLLRKAARKSGNTTEFSEFLDKVNPSFRNYVSDNDLDQLYKKFRKGTFNKYVQDLADSWNE